MTDDRPDHRTARSATLPGILNALPERVRVALAAHAVATAPQAVDLLVRLDEDPEARSALGISAEDLFEGQRILSSKQPVMVSGSSSYAEIPLGVPVDVEPGETAGGEERPQDPENDGKDRP